MAARKPKKKPAKKKPAATNAAPKKRTLPDWAPAFLEAFADCGNISRACEVADVDRRTFYRRRDADKQFAADVREADKIATGRLEDEAWRRAHDGTERPVFGSGGAGIGSVQVGTVREYSDTLLIFLLKARRPKKYRERIEHKHKGSLRVRRSGDLSRLTDDQLDQLENLLAVAETPTQLGGRASGEVSPATG